MEPLALQLAQSKREQPQREPQARQVSLLALQESPPGRLVARLSAPQVSPPRLAPRQLAPEEPLPAASSQLGPQLLLPMLPL